MFHLGFITNDFLIFSDSNVSEELKSFSFKEKNYLPKISDFCNQPIHLNQLRSSFLLFFSFNIDLLNPLLPFNSIYWASRTELKFYLKITIAVLETQSNDLNGKSKGRKN